MPGEPFSLCRVARHRDRRCAARRPHKGWNRTACDVAVFNLGATNPLRDRAGSAVLTKPLRHIEQLGGWLGDVLTRPQPRRSLVVVGGGPAGTEVMLNVSARLRRSARPDALRFTLVHPGDRLMPQFAPSMGRRAERMLRGRAAELRLESKVAQVEEDATLLEGGARFPLPRP